MRTAQRCWRGPKSDLLTSTREEGVERCAGIQLCFTHERFRDAGRQGGVTSSSCGFLRAELLHTTQGAWLLPCHGNPGLGFTTNSVTGVSPASPRPPALSVSHLRYHELYSTEGGVGGRQSWLNTFAQCCFRAMTAPPAPFKPVGALLGTQ